ncbi:putative ribonuclease H protein [Vitis vinifera]|uniref:Putative ribonuclease H protein n=1 Tax=Vitis vinifera TaxID=29760 RepID=A0A438CDU6_VITVI|nr:putative ribonuclease H protein [Vitis vinifera]
MKCFYFQRLKNYSHKEHDGQYAHLPDVSISNAQGSSKKLEKLQRDFLWGGGNLERKAHLVKWEVVCADKEKGGLGIRKLALLNKALLGRWIWRFTFEKENLWKKVVSVKYGKRALVGGQMRLMGRLEWGLEGDFEGNKMVLGKYRVHSWNATVDEVWDPNFGQGGWNLRFIRAFNDWELDLVGDLLTVLRGYILTLEEVSVTWKGGRNGKFGVKEAYRLLITPNYISFSKNCIWVVRVPTKVVFFCLGGYVGEGSYPR